MAFASETDLGFDTSIERVSVKVIKEDKKAKGGTKREVVKDKITYNIRCNGICYQVLDVLSDYKAGRILGRASRVWKVQQVQDQDDGHSVLVGDVLVMKDVWIDQDSPSEGYILQDIFNKLNMVHPIEGLDPASVQKLFTEHFETTTVDEIVMVGNLNLLQEDTTKTILRDSALPTEAKALRMTPLPSHNTRKASVIDGSLGPPQYGSPGSIPDGLPLTGGKANKTATKVSVALNPLASCAKQHRRILYKDYGQALDNDEAVLHHKRWFTSLAKVAAGKNFYQNLFALYLGSSCQASSYCLAQGTSIAISALATLFGSVTAVAS